MRSSASAKHGSGQDSCSRSLRESFDDHGPATLDDFLRRNSGIRTCGGVLGPAGSLLLDRRTRQFDAGSMGSRDRSSEAESSPCLQRGPAKTCWTRLRTSGLRTSFRSIFKESRPIEPVVLAWMPAASLYFRDPDGNLIEFLSMLPDAPQPGLGIVRWSRWKASSI